MEPLIELFREDTQSYDEDSVSISIVPSNVQFNENLDHSFMYTQILKEFLLEIEYDEQSLSHLADYYRIQCADNPSTASRKTTSNTRLFGGIPRRILFIQCSIVLYVH